MSKRIANIIVSVFGTVILGFILYQAILLVYVIVAGPSSTRAYDVSRRLTSPNGINTALLVRDYAFDLNFKLFIVDKSYDSAPRSNTYIWLSHDYNPGTNQNFHEDLKWSKDSSVIAVIIEGEYVFAYDFNSETEYKNTGEIEQLLELRNEFE